MGRILRPDELPAKKVLSQAELNDDLHDRIGATMSRWALKPTPASYAVMHAIVTEDDDVLLKRVRSVQAERGMLNDALVSALYEAHVQAQHRLKSDKPVAVPGKAANTPKADNDESVIVLSPEAVSRITDEARAVLNSVSAEINRSGNDAKGYASGLQGFIDGGSSANELISLTLVMIEKTLEAETRMAETALQLETIREELQDARSKAAHDPLTGLPNRRTLDSTLKAAAENAVAQNTALAVAIVDIDHFKSINDTYGHPIGDQVIKVVGQMLTQVQGDTPFVGRYGGEEFVMVFDGISPEEAARRIDGVRGRLEGMRLRCADTGKELNRITFCAGVSGTPLRRTSTELLQSADKALYRAKHDGRNLVRVAGEAE